MTVSGNIFHVFKAIHIIEKHTSEKWNVEKTSNFLDLLNGSKRFGRAVQVKYYDKPLAVRFYFGGRTMHKKMFECLALAFSYAYDNDLEF